MNSLIETLNRWGGRIPNFAWPMLWQSSVLIAALFVFDLAARRKVRASVRYALWLVVLVKLLLPPTLALPTSLAWWVRPPAPPPKAQARTTAFVVTYGDVVPANFPTPAPPVFVPPPKPSLSGAGRAAATWALVGAGLLAWLVARWRQVAGNVRQAAVAPPSLNEVLGEAKHCIKLPRRVRLMVMERAMSPAVCGLFRPVILLPQALVERLTPSQLRAVVLHELAHLRRGDVWVNCGQALLQIFYWWHPLLWLANARIRRAREEAVDDAVMLALRDDADTYAPTLLEVAKLAFNRPLASLGLVGILESRSALRQRIERLVDFRPPPKAGLTIASAFCVLAFAALAVPMEKAPPTREKPSPTKDTSYSSGTISSTPVSANSADSKTNVSELVQHGRLLLETGKLDEAEAELKLAVGIEPDNRFALYYLRLVSETRLAKVERPAAERAPVLGDVPLVDRLFRTESTSTPTPSTREALYTRTFRLDTKVQQWLESITGLSLDNDQESAFNPGTLLLPGVSPQEIERTRDLVSLSPDLRQTRDRGAITFITRTNDMQLVSVAVATFFSALGVDLASPNAIASGKSIFWSDRSGWLLVRATKQDLDVIEHALADFEAKPASGIKPMESPTAVVTGVNQAMGLTKSRIEALTNRVPVLGDLPLVGKLFRSETIVSPVRTPQILIRARFVEVGQDDIGALGFDWYLGNLLLANRAATNSVVHSSLQFHAVLTDPQFRAFLRALEQREGSDILAAPAITTVSGRQVQLQAVDLKTVVTGINLQAQIPPGILSGHGVTNSIFETQAIPFGSVLDLMPVVSADGYTINMMVSPTVTESLGYDDSTNFVPAYINGQRTNIALPLPRFRVRQTTVNAAVRDGQTLVLAKPVVTEISKKPDGSTETKDVSSTQKKQLIVFVTPRLVDEAGNPLHSNEELDLAPR